jgi:Major Facilitator Superfamily
MRQSTLQYGLITGNYWAFTLTDGALRMLVILHFHTLGYSPLAIASLFLLYEVLGVVTNLVGGYVGARIGLNRTMNIGLALQVAALALLAAPTSWLTVPWVMGAQAISGIAKDLNKMSAKSAIKLLVPGGEDDGGGSRLYRWIALLTGSKNALKGLGFFLGAALLSTVGFRGSLIGMAAGLLIVWIMSLILVGRDLGKAKAKPKFRDVLSKSRAVNVLSAARFFLFASRDVWFVVALPVFLSDVFGWDFWLVGGFLAAWIIGYGVIQSAAPLITGISRSAQRETIPDGRTAFGWALVLAGVPAAIALGLGAGLSPVLVVVTGLAVFGFLFAVNSALHSYLIVSYASEEGVSLDVGFYYMSNAAGRLAGTVLSGWAFQAYGLGSEGLRACLWISSACIATAAALSAALPRHGPNAKPVAFSESGD